MPERRPSQIAITLGLVRYMLIATLRNRNSLIFGLVFPLIFVEVFGSLGGGSASKATVGLSRDLAASSAPLVLALKTLDAQKDGPVKLEIGEAASLQTEVSQGNLGALIEKGDVAGQFTVVTSSANPIAGATAGGIIQSIANRVNLFAAEAAAGPGFSPVVELKSKDISGKISRYIDFVLPGMIGFSLIFTATFGVAFPLLVLRRTLVLKRMLATSARPISFVVSQCLSRSVQAVMQSAILILIGIGQFKFALPHGLATVLEMLVIAFLGVCVFMGFGILIANIAKDEQSAPLIINLFNMPQLLLAGVFFPTDAMPKWVQLIGNNLPLSYVNQAMRALATDGKHLPAVLPQIGGMLAWSLVAYIAAAKTFRVEN